MSIYDKNVVVHTDFDRPSFITRCMRMLYKEHNFISRTSHKNIAGSSALNSSGIQNPSSGQQRKSTIPKMKLTEKQFDVKLVVNQ